MRRDVILALGLRVFGALAWLIYVWLLTRLLPPEDLGITLYALALAGLLGGLLVAGRAGHILRNGARAFADHDLLRFSQLLGQGLWEVACRGLVMIFGVTLLVALGGLPRLSPAWPLGLLTAVSALSLAMLGVLSNAERARKGLLRAMLAQGVFKAVLPACALMLATQLLWPATPTLVLALFSGAVALTSVWLLATLPRPRRKPPDTAERRNLRALWAAQAGGLVLNHLDILVLGWLLSPLEAASYLLARRLAGLLALLFDGLRSALAPRLAVAFQQTRGFGPLSARVNLGFLLIGAGGGGVLFLIGPLLLPLFGAELAEARGVFFWLILGQVAPALFGATGMMMVMTDMEQTRARLVWLLLPPGAGALLWAGTQGSVELAMATSGLHLGFAAISAVLLARRHGVLPGATALLYPRLRLR